MYRLPVHAERAAVAVESSFGGCHLCSQQGVQPEGGRRQYRPAADVLQQRPAATGRSPTPLLTVLIITTRILADLFAALAMLLIALQRQVNDCKVA